MAELLHLIAQTYDTYCWPTIGPVAVDVVTHRHHVRFTTSIGEQYEMPLDWMAPTARTMEPAM